MRQHNRVQQDLLGRHAHTAAEYRDRRIQLAVAVEQRRILHFGERLVRIRIAGRALDARPLADGALAADCAKCEMGGTDTESR